MTTVTPRLRQTLTVPVLFTSIVHRAVSSTDAQCEFTLLLFIAKDLFHYGPLHFLENYTSFGHKAPHSYKNVHDWPMPVTGWVTEPIKER